MSDSTSDSELKEPPLKRRRVVSSNNSQNKNNNSAISTTENRHNWENLACTSAIHLFKLIQPKLLFGNVTLVCKSWNTIISKNNFTFGYFKDTCKQQLGSYNSDQLQGLTCNILRQTLIKLNLSTKGRKSQLVERIFNSMKPKNDNNDDDTTTNNNNNNTNPDKNKAQIKNTENSNKNKNNDTTTPRKAATPEKRQNNSNSSSKKTSINGNNSNTNINIDIDSSSIVDKHKRPIFIKLQIQAMTFVNKNRLNQRCQNCLKIDKYHILRDWIGYYQLKICHKCLKLTEFDLVSLDDIIQFYGLNFNDLQLFNIKFITKNVNIPANIYGMQSSGRIPLTLKNRGMDYITSCQKGGGGGNVICKVHAQIMSNNNFTKARTFIQQFCNKYSNKYVNRRVIFALANLKYKHKIYPSLEASVENKNTDEKQANEYCNFMYTTKEQRDLLFKTPKIHYFRPKTAPCDWFDNTSKAKANYFGRTSKEMEPIWVKIFQKSKPVTFDDFEKLYIEACAHDKLGDNDKTRSDKLSLLFKQLSTRNELFYNCINLVRNQVYTFVPQRDELDRYTDPKKYTSWRELCKSNSEVATGNNSNKQDSQFQHRIDAFFNTKK